LAYEPQSSATSTGSAEVYIDTFYSLFASDSHLHVDFSAEIILPKKRKLVVYGNKVVEDLLEAS